MNRAQRRAARRGRGPLAGRVCTHGNVMKTDGDGNPNCPHGCGFTQPDVDNRGRPKPTLREHLAAIAAEHGPAVDYRGRGA